MVIFFAEIRGARKLWRRETDSKKIVSMLKKDKALLKRNLKNFEREISHLGGNPVVVALGSAAYDILQRFNGKYKIMHLPHYSYTRINKEQYRDEVRNTLKTYRRCAKK